MDQLPLLDIFEHLSIIDLINFSRTNKNLYNYTKLKYTWNMLLFRDYSLSSDNTEEVYKEKYKDYLNRKRLLSQIDDKSVSVNQLTKWQDDIEIIDKFDNPILFNNTLLIKS